MKTIAFVDNTGGVDKTSLVYHLAWMFADRGIKTLAVDFDPHANLTSMFLSEERLEELWPDGEHPDTIYGAIRPVMEGTGDVVKPYIEKITEKLGLIPGDLWLSQFEYSLSDAWLRCHSGDEAAFRTMNAFHRLVQHGVAQGVELILVDVGPNLGAINRSALIASDQVCLLVTPDLFSLRGLKNIGLTLNTWREDWKKLLQKAPVDVPMPQGAMQPVGYIVVMQHGIFYGRPVKAYQRWLDRIPQAYRESVLGEDAASNASMAFDPHMLALLKNYRSLMPMAMEANKPIFFLKSADGAIGAHQEAVASCYMDFKNLAGKIAANAGVVFS